MKKRINKIMGVGLVLTLLFSLILAAVPVSASELSWGRFSDPRQTTNQISPAAGLNILDIAAANDGNTVYAATGALGTGLYKSTNGGMTYAAVTIPAALGFASVDLVAVAADDGNVVIVADTTASAIVMAASTNGGTSWSGLSFPVGAAAGQANLVYDIAISGQDGSVRYVAAAGAATAPLADNDTPRLLYFNLGATVPAWTDAVFGAAWDAGAGLATGFVSIAGDDAAEIDAIKTIEFSPFFPSDLTAVAVSEEFGGVLLETGEMRLHTLSFNQKKWDATAGFTGYPVSIQSASAVAAAFTVNQARVALDPNYLGGDDTSRIAFIAAQITDASGELGGLWRYKDTSAKQLMTTTAMWSVDWDGALLVSGPQGSNQVRYSTDALATSPSMSSARVLKRPGFPTATNTQVAFAGASVVAGNSGVGLSAAAISTDGAVTFNDVALIDYVAPATTAWTTVQDIAVSADGTATYVLTDDGTNSMLWKKEGSSWSRIWVQAGLGTTQYLVRIAPDDSDVVYLADQGGTNMWFSDDAGDTWRPRASRYTIQDVAVESTEVAYVAVGAANTVSKTTNMGFTWADSKSTKLSGGDTCSSITVIAEDQLIVGGVGGYVSYSTDGNANWTNITTMLNTAGAVVATADMLDAGGFIYAGTATSNVVERWQIGTSTTWRNLGSAPTVTGGATAVADVLGIDYREDALYVLHSDAAADSVVARTINPTALNPTWSYTAVDAPTALAISSLRTSAGSTMLWFIDNATQNVRTYTDTLVGAGPTLLSPADGYNLMVNPVSGATYNVAFSWERPFTIATIGARYDLQVATDTAFNELVIIATGAAAVPAAATTSSTVTSVQAGGGVLFPGTTYYWRVRVTPSTPLHSPWSATREFTVNPLGAAAPGIQGPEAGSTTGSMPSFSWTPVAGATSYAFVLADNPSLTTPIVDATTSTTAYAVTAALEVGKTYYWAVKALQPVESEWSAVANFVVAAPVTPTTTAPPVTITTQPAPTITITQPPATTITIPAPEQPAPITPAFIWAIIIIGAILVIAVIVLIVRTRRSV